MENFLLWRLLNNTQKMLQWAPQKVVAAPNLPRFRKPSGTGCVCLGSPAPGRERDSAIRVGPIQVGIVCDQKHRFRKEIMSLKECC